MPKAAAMVDPFVMGQGKWVRAMGQGNGPRHASIAMYFTMPSESAQGLGRDGRLPDILNNEIVWFQKNKILFLAPESVNV